MNPFAALGLPAAAGLTDEEVRAAWRQAAARTHPDRDDGGDTAAYTAVTQDSPGAAMDGGSGKLPGLDTSVANATRMWNYWIRHAPSGLR